MKNLFIGLLFILSALMVNAQDIISVEDLARDLRKSNLVIISAGPKSEYDKQHITGSINIPFNAFDRTGPIEGLLVPDAEIAKLFGDRGVSDKNSIVVYDEFDGRYAARIYFLLKYLGAKDVKVLDGGLSSWREGRRPITRNPTNLSKTTFAASPNRNIMVTAQHLATTRQNSVLVDARSPGEYRGRENNSKGHIQGAINIDYKELLTANGRLKPKAELERVYTSKGVTRDKEVILYCTSGVRTGIHYLVLTSALGYTNVKVYDGGLNEWGSINPGRIAQ